MCSKIVAPMTHFQELVRQIKKIPIVTSLENSLDFSANSERCTFSIYERLDEKSALGAIGKFLEIVQFDSQFNEVVQIARLIESINGTKKFPLCGAGFASANRNEFQLKIYYMLSIIEFDKEDAMPIFNDELSREVVQKLLSKLNMEEKQKEVDNTIKYMVRKGNHLHIIGLNIEKNKPLSLKIYFCMGK